MRIFYHLFLLAFILPFFSLAQSNYRPGYVVTLKGDTLRGFIDYREWSNNPDAILFKPVLSDAKSSKFTPTDITFFNINNIETYQKYTGPISMDVVNTDHLTTGKDTSVRMAEVFLRVLQKGKNLTLYSYTDDLKPRYFVGDSPGFAPKELVYRIYEANDANGNGKTFTDETYLKQLNTLAIKYGMLNDDLTYKLQKANYDKPQLIDIVGKINGLTKQQLNGRSNDSRSRYKIYFYGATAVNITSNTPGATSPYIKNGGKSYTSYMPAFSFGFSAPANPEVGAHLFRGELSVAFSKYVSRYTNGAYPYIPVRASFSAMSIGITPQVIYNFYNAQNFKVYAGVGFNISKSTYTNVFYGPEDPGAYFPVTNEYFFDDFDTRILLKTGVQVNKHFEAFFNYLTSAPTTKLGYFQLSNSISQLGMNYIF